MGKIRYFNATGLDQERPESKPISLSMSRSIAKSMQCPQCGQKQPFVMWDSINVTADPLLKAPLLRRELCTLRCVKCGSHTLIEHDLLYHDMEQRFMVWLGSFGEREAASAVQASIGSVATRLKDYRLRLVCSFNELVEKVMIFDADIDDRTVEVLKDAMPRIPGGDRRMAFCDVYFAGERQEAGIKHWCFHLLDAAGTTEWLLPADSGWIQTAHLIASARDEYAHLNGRWLRIDRAWAMDRAA